MNTVTSSRLNELILFASLLYISPVSGNEKKSDLIYILEWTTTYEGPDWPYRYIEMGQNSFTSRNCSFQNCFITTNRTYLKNEVDYDVLMFNAVHYTRLTAQNFNLPTNRSQNQQYLLFSVEPAAYCPIPNSLKGSIDLTWTYKLDSDIVHPYIIVKNNFNEMVGPKIDTHWINITDLPPINSTIIQKLKHKRLAAMWMVTNCLSKERYVYIRKLQNELGSKYGLQLDIIGRCGSDSCLKNNEGFYKCYESIERDYYFYLAFENSNSEDYVSEKVLHGLNHFAVPIVYGGADYSRFMPDGIYLNAKKFTTEELANEMYNIINNPPRYYEFFKWHGYYTFHDTITDMYSYTICEFCAFLNNQKRKHNRIVKIYDNIVDWWNVPAPVDYTYQDLLGNLQQVEGNNEAETTTSWNLWDFFLDV